MNPYSAPFFLSCLINAIPANFDHICDLLSNLRVTASTDICNDS